uniref:TBC1 domain family, member 19 n=1 Tax=Callorhinchus milii TaxID=7868 RepID=A0A4W3IWV5_CALMI
MILLWHSVLTVLPPPSHPSAPIEHIKEALAYMRRAQVYWEKRVLKSLNSMCTELNIPLAQKRSLDDQKELLNKWNEMGTDEPGILKGLPELRELFAELGLNYGQLGIDDSIQIPTGNFQFTMLILCSPVVLSEQDSAAAQQYIRQGCPTGLRADTWALILNISNQMEDSLYYDQLKSNVIQHDLLVDSLIYKDVKLTASNDDYYFVFEDYLYQVLLCFSRDTMVLDHFSYSSASPPRSYIRGKKFIADICTKCTVIENLCFVAPLCFLYHEPSKLYQVFREMYVRYFFRLHSISSHPSGIVSLCLLFETLVQTYLPQLFYRLREIGAQPLRISFKWMVRAFSGYLATDQLLFLWDRILGYNSLEILAVLAAAVFAFRAENLMEATSLAAAEAVLADLSTLKVMPLLQLFLFATVP